jgi:predicted esterase
VTEVATDHDGSGAEGREPRPPTLHRRTLLILGLGGAALLAAGGATALELIAHGVLPGQQTLDQLDGSCSVESPPFDIAKPGPLVSGTFYSAARHRRVGYTIGYPPGHGPGAALPLIVMLHGFGGNHTDALAGLTPAEAVSLRVGGEQLAPMAMVTVDGGGGYWNPHPHDDPMGMVIHELLPLCQRMGLGRPPLPIGTMGISMGGYGAILLAERYPHLFSAVAAISPAIWTTFAEAHAANAGAYASEDAFRANDAIALTPRLKGRPVRVATGEQDPFRPGVEALIGALPSGAVTRITPGCHTGPFFVSQEPPSLLFLGQHLTA